MRRRILLLSLAAAGLALSGCKKPPPAKTAPAAQTRAVSVARVELRAIQGSLTATGDLTPFEEAAVLPEVTGYRVAAVLADVGQWVKKGQVLVRLDPSLIQAQIAQAQAQFEQAQDQANRVRGLDNSGVLSQEQIEQRRIQARVAAAQLRDLKTRYAKMNVTAPVNGLVLEKNVRPGDLSAGGSTPYFRLARDGLIELQAQLAEEDLAKVHPGTAVMVTLPDGAVVNGTVRLVSPQVDPNTKLGFVRVRLPVRSDIRSGGFGRAVFVGASSSAPSVPDSAISYDADGASVMVVGADNRIHRVLVQAGQRGGGWVQLVKGPPVGTRIVRAAGGLLLDGDLIRPVEAGAAAPPKTAAAR
jgi:HlyD family secretion protein